ncbi:redox-regulated ATPase YchF [Geosporobacter ferrireducens]|uniref:Ribosome-binding ATPase YchF n=1 Tax=Geosporobacter ferrireducens TaxID=1424294 RepID=A0A1D8GC45_9FIRM|nr:redox-regulated ATPase YchF [Geosporobacter ferrireducens]AOT68473.1 redox-regulated ATPase YchF [Geosporobacter ferrireducens]MTI53935.1 redox-regulated ATPase YchF [Geosporobacter ferrireducens]
MKLGIVGLPNVGKSTLFNAITKAGAESANYPFCTIEPNVGVVSVPDHRLDVLYQMYNSEKKVPAVIEFYDIAGLVRGASQGEGLGNKFLSHIREVVAIVHVVRCFEDDNIVHVEGSVGPLRDIETINLELIFSDLEMIERRLQKTNKLVKSDKSYQLEFDLLQRVKDTLESGKSIRGLDLTKEEKEIVKDFNLLSYKPIIYVANVSEDDLLENGANNEMVQQVREHAKSENAEVVVICAKIESEIAELDDAEKVEFLQDLGLEESGLDLLIKAGYSLLNLMSFLTAGPKEVRAWTIRIGTKAPQAAGKIHSDIERGFIRAETISFDELVAAGSIAAAKEKGLVRLEGKEYIVQDGDVILFRFNV